jgi:hypothetical protein
MSQASTELYEARENVANALKHIEHNDLIEMMAVALDHMNKAEIETMLKFVGLDLTDVAIMATK